MDPYLAAVATGVVIFALAVVLAGRGRRTDASDRLRQARIERQLQLIVDHFGIVEPQPTYPDVVAALDQGRKIQAIKAYREATGSDLATAKAAVEALARTRGL